jgi:hypothetical protein
MPAAHTEQTTAVATTAAATTAVRHAPEDLDASL